MSIIHQSLFQALGVHQGKNKANSLSSGNVGPAKREQFVVMTQVCRTAGVAQGHCCMACVCTRGAQNTGSAEIGAGKDIEK